MNRSVTVGAIASLLGLSAFVPLATGFLDELETIRTELQAYQENKTGTFAALADTAAAAAQPLFTDVLPQDWFSPYVGSVASWGIVTGYLRADGTPVGEFKPASPVTVAEALKMTYEAAGVDESLCMRPPFHSQAGSHWARLYVSCAEEANMRMFRGAEADLNRPVRRAELLTMVHDAFGDTVLPLYAGFHDAAGHAYEADIAYAVARGLVSGDLDVAGKSTGYFRPDANINRAETAKILYNRLIVKAKEADFPALP